MAMIHKGKQSLRGKARKLLLMSAVCGGLIPVYGVMLLNSGRAGEIHPIAHLLPLLLFIGIFVYFNRYKTMKAGAAGETNLLAELRKLPGDYHVFTNYIIRQNSRYDEVDFIVVGGNGVFVIEAKNHVGRISGKAHDAKWRQEKFKARGKIVHKKMANPIKQTKAHLFNVTKIIRAGGFHTGISALLVFTNPHVYLTIETEALLVVRGSEKVNHFILDYLPVKRLDASTIDGIVRHLKKIAG